MKKINFLIIFSILLISCSVSVNNSNEKKLLPPPKGAYIGAFPDLGSTEDSVTIERLNNYKELTGHIPVWVYFSNNWYNGIKFPAKEVQIINSFGSIPFIRLMPRSDFTIKKQDPAFSLKNIIDGKFDKELVAYAIDSKKSNIPIMIEFGTEMNGDWFPWSGLYNRKDPANYKKAYIHIINIFRKADADNITWVFHTNWESSPNVKWNKMSAYYPGDEYIDWIGISIYGGQKPGDEWSNFKENLNEAYSEMTEVSDEKPFAIFEFGTIDDTAKGDKAKWIKNVFNKIKSEKYPRIKALSYWHSFWVNEDGSVSNMRLDSSPEALNAYKEAISNSYFTPKVIMGLSK